MRRGDSGQRSPRTFRVAARGLDIKDLGIVINYDFPNNIEDYATFDVVRGGGQRPPFRQFMTVAVAPAE
jgi:hypothetical protein